MTDHNCSKNKPVATTPSRQRTISSYCTQPSSSKECPLIQKRITEACVEYCAVDVRPFESVAGTGFQNLAKQLIYAEATLGTSINVSELLPHPSTVSIHYGGISLHYIDEQSQLRVFTLSCQPYDFETQHAINLRSFVNKVLQEYGLYLNDDVFIVTDNENKMKCAFKDDCKRIGCSAHYLNKILQLAFTNNNANCNSAQSLFKLVRAIITNIRQSHKQSLLSICLVNYSDTRFSGIYLMFNSFLKVYYELPQILSDEQKKNYLKVDRDILESLCIYLKKFFHVIEKLSCEKTPTIHLVIHYKQLLINLSVINDNDDQLIIPLKKYIAKELPDYWIVNDVHFIATMLHPNLKSFNHTPHQRYHAEALLKSEFDKYQELQQQPSASNNNNKRQQIQQHKNTQLASSLDDIFDSPTSPDELQDEKLAKTEFDRYIEDNTKIDKDMNILIYWKNNKSSYPTLAKIAKRILSIPATNTSVERLFSDSGNTITNRRTRLQTSKVNQLLFIRRNLSVLRELFPPSIEQIKKRKNSNTSTTPTKKRKYSTEDDDKDLSQEDDNNDVSQEDENNDVSQDDLGNVIFEVDDKKENSICDD
ncbi:unnamed protein product [Rotaria sordida]|uniref:HAT C-terminal dimerisation domain-containing protein n=1 Tax=Rotaria sordida TaxID=392033 RepID=A0A819Q7P4_9BILA|nr:unnamed protein product [Rotaria sordida]